MLSIGHSVVRRSHPVTGHDRDTAPFDVIVVGAGPGGSSAAAACLLRGLSVAQIDRYRFPRMKPCGGGITVKAYNALPFDPSPVLHGESRDIDLNIWQKRHNRFTRRSTALLRMVVRPEFDNWLVSENLEAPGFQFFDDERVLDISYDGLFSVRTSDHTLRSRHLVGADGAYSLVNKLFRVTQPRGYAVAVEVVIPRGDVTVSEAIPPCFDLEAIPAGYGWVFPKDDHWNVGLYTLAKQKNLRESLVEYIRRKGFRVRGDPLATCEAHLIPYGGYRIALPSAPVYVVGDAGGFADPMTGEGIYHAVESGRIAGETIADCVAGKARPEAYYQRLRPSVLRETRMTYHLAKAFYRNADRALTVLENPLLWRPLIEGFADGATLSQTVARAWWLLPKSLAAGQIRHRRDRISQPLAVGGR